ncbi:MAG: bifunctional oligoribonuclease/PAP phosphatase NrnA [Candidatus Omnitrophica bacterium]|nr:bifunctional oligoribonuclease/PAP phosphatase NrnA [Candidatus Omnitrophota bacterium]
MIEKIIYQIKLNKNFLLTSHLNLEGDAIGSLLAMRDILLFFKKRVSVVIQDKIPEEYRFLPHINAIRNIKNIKLSDYDVLITLDVSDEKRCQKVIDLFPQNKTIINIDHHISNTRFGKINWIDSNASSTVEMIYKLYKRLNIALNKKRALWLYVGLLTDTGSFRYPNTNAGSLKLAGKLINYGLNISNIYQNIYYTFNLNEIKIIAQILSTLKSDMNQRLVWFKMKREFFKKDKPKRDLADEILNLGRLIKKAEVIVLFKEDLSERNIIHVNLRSKNKIDVDRFARYFGGGGHRTASGCNIKGDLEKVENMVIKKIKEFINGGINCR